MNDDFVERLVAGQLLSRMTELEEELAAERSECLEQAKLVAMFADRWEREKRLSDQLVADLDALHRPVCPDQYGEVCANCGCFWPCATHLLLHPEEASRG